MKENHGNGNSRMRVFVSLVVFVLIAYAFVFLYKENRILNEQHTELIESLQASRRDVAEQKAEHVKCFSEFQKLTDKELALQQETKGFDGKLSAKQTELDQKKTELAAKQTTMDVMNEQLKVTRKSILSVFAAVDGTVSSEDPNVEVTPEMEEAIKNEIARLKSSEKLLKEEVEKLKNEKPAKTGKPAETAKPAETEKPAEPEKPAETEKPAEPEKPAET